MTKENIKTVRFKRVLFGFIVSPFLLGATFKHHLEKYDTELAREVINKEYVDNVVLSCNNIQDGYDKYREIKRVFNKAKMNIREFISISKALNDKLKEKISKRPQ